MHKSKFIFATLISFFLLPLKAMDSDSKIFNQMKSDLAQEANIACSRTIETELDIIKWMFITPDGNNIVCSDLHTVLVIDYKSGMVKAKKRFPEEIYKMCVSQNGNRIVITTFDSNDVYILDYKLNTIQLIKTDMIIRDSIVTPNGQYIIVVPTTHSNPYTIKIYDAESGELYKSYVGNKVYWDNRSIVQALDTTKIMIAAKEDDGLTLEVWDWETEKTQSVSSIKDVRFIDNSTPLHNNSIVFEAFNTAEQSKNLFTINIFDCSTFQNCTLCKTSIDVGFSSNNLLLKSEYVIQSDVHDIKIWDRKSAVLLNTLEGKKSIKRDYQAYRGPVAITPDGMQLVTESQDSVIKIWDLKPLTDYLKYYEQNCTKLSFESFQSNIQS